MKQVNTSFCPFVSEESMLRYVQDAIRMVDPQYPKEEQQYLAACDILKKETSKTVLPDAEAYIRAKEQVFSSHALYAAWQGFLLNLRIFQNPVNALMLREDFEELHQERRMHTLPVAREAQRTINSFCQRIPEGQRNLTATIDDYFAYLQTVGYKLAHYIGFLFGNCFLPKVIPGYVVDGVCTDRYTNTLREVLQMDVNRIRYLL